MRAADELREIRVMIIFAVMRQRENGGVADFGGKIGSKKILRGRGDVAGEQIGNAAVLDPEHEGILVVKTFGIIARFGKRPERIFGPSTLTVSSASQASVAPLRKPLRYFAPDFSNAFQNSAL